MQLSNLLLSSFLVATVISTVSAGTLYKHPKRDRLRKREDYRELYSFTGGDGTTACNTWRCQCINYVPSNTDLTFDLAYCVPGDDDGENTTTEALAYCAFVDSSGEVTTINKHTASASDFTLLASSC